MRAAVSLGFVSNRSLILSWEVPQYPSAPGSKTLRLNTTGASVNCAVQNRDRISHQEYKSFTVASCLKLTRGFEETIDTGVEVIRHVVAFRWASEEVLKHTTALHLVWLIPVISSPPSRVGSSQTCYCPQGRGCASYIWGCVQLHRRYEPWPNA